MSQYDLDELLSTAVAQRASDIHLAPGAPPLMRLHSVLEPIHSGDVPLTNEWLQSSLFGILSPGHREEFETNREVDLSYSIEGVARFRVNIYQEMHGIAAAFRPIPDAVIPLEQIGLPPIIKELAMRPRGLVLVTGPTGSGKSTTLAAMIDAINTERSAHIVTVEDPIEFVHRNKHSLINQREVGSDTASFQEALRRVLRQDPDVILIGELRDLETMQVAMTAAETGHLVLGTLHTQGAANAINRIVDAFPSHQQNQVRAQLADTLQGVISQSLVRKASGDGRVAATEIMVRTPAVANLIREGQVAQLYSVLQTGSQAGMHTLDQELRRLVESGSIEIHEALRFVVDPQTLEHVVVRMTDEFDVENWVESERARQAAGDLS